ncbi:MAG: hypothetical protein KAI83_20245 [Thiomargarita sp.]|nr:hypothetical protein [Thiomargarita sp.]
MKNEFNTARKSAIFGKAYSRHDQCVSRHIINGPLKGAVFTNRVWQEGFNPEIFCSVSLPFHEQSKAKEFVDNAMSASTIPFIHEGMEIRRGKRTNENYEVKVLFTSKTLPLEAVKAIVETDLYLALEMQEFEVKPFHAQKLKIAFQQLNEHQYDLTAIIVWTAKLIRCDMKTAGNLIEQFVDGGFFTLNRNFDNDIMTLIKN